MVKNYIIHQYWGVVINPSYNNPLWGFLLCDGWPFDPGPVLWVTSVVTSLHFLDVKQWYYHFSFLPLVRRPQFSWWWLLSYHKSLSPYEQGSRDGVKGCTCRDLEEQSPLEIDSGTSLLVRPHLDVSENIPPTWHFELGMWSLSAGFGAILFSDNVEMALDFWLFLLVISCDLHIWQTSCCFLHIWCFFRTHFLRLHSLVNSSTPPRRLGSSAERWIGFAGPELRDVTWNLCNQQEWGI